mgnify:CR=1 FL=1
MKLTTEQVRRLVLAQMLLKEAKKDVAFYLKRAEVEKTEKSRIDLANAERAAAFYEQEVYTLS